MPNCSLVFGPIITLIFGWGHRLSLCNVQGGKFDNEKWAQSPKRGQLVLTPDTYFSAESVWWSKLHWWWESRRPAALSSLAWRQWGPHTVTPRLSSHISLKKMKELIHRGWSLSASQANSGCQKNWILFYPPRTISKSTLRITSVHFTCDFFCTLAYFFNHSVIICSGLIKADKHNCLSSHLSLIF